jgi:hypothetical protein
MAAIDDALTAFNSAQKVVDQLFKDLGATVPNSTAYIKTQKAYNKAKDVRDVKKKVYDDLESARKSTEKKQTETALTQERNQTLLQQSANAAIETAERSLKSAQNSYQNDPNDRNKANNYLNALTTLDSVYTDFEKQGVTVKRLVVKQSDGTVIPAGTPAAAVETAPVVTSGVSSTGGDQPVRAGVGRSVVAPTEVVAEEPPPTGGGTDKPKVVIKKEQVDAKLVELKLPDTPENRKTARQALKNVVSDEKPGDKTGVVDTAWETLFKKNYPTYAWMFTDLDRTKYADVFELFKLAQDKNMPTEEFDRRFRGTSFDRELESSKKGRELSASIGNFTWGSGQLAKFLTKSIQFGYTGENLKQQAYAELFSKTDGKYVNDVAVKEVRASTPYLALKDIGKQYFWDIGDSLVEQVLSGTPNAENVAVSRDDLVRKARLYAKGKYAHLSEQIDGGLTMEDMAASYREKAAKLLELDPNTMNFDRDYSDALGNVDRPRVLSMSEWETELRTNDKYKYSFTKQANQDATSIGLAIARAFGKVQ